MTHIVIEVSDQDKELVLALEQLASLVAAIQGPCVGGKSIDYANIERDVGAASAAIERAAHRWVLRGLDIDAEKVRIRGALHSRVGRVAESPSIRLFDTLTDAKQAAEAI